jgi:hypothetical protein
MMMLDGNDHFQAPEEEVDKYYSRRAKSRQVPEAAVEECRLNALTAGSYVRHSLYAQKSKEAKGKRGEQTASLVSLGQSTENHGHISESVPTLLRTSQVFSLDKVRELIPLEHLSTMGLPVFPHLKEKTGYSCPFQGLLDSDSLADSDIKQLAGNSVPLVILGAAIIWAFSNITRRDPASMGSLLHDDGSHYYEDSQEPQATQPAQIPVFQFQDVEHQAGQQLIHTKQQQHAARLQTLAGASSWFILNNNSKLPD